MPPPLKKVRNFDDSHCVFFCSASRPIPSPSFNTEAVETPRAATISPLRSGQEFDDTYSIFSGFRLYLGLSDYPVDKYSMK